MATLGAAGLSACAAPFEIADGKKKPKGGIGGTGIVGTLTDFGSLIVNGLTIETDGSTTVADTFGRVPASTLAIGQTLTIEAATEEGKLIARRVRIDQPVIGTVEQVGPDGRAAVVAGVEVVLEPTAIGRLVAGSRAIVSGVWRNTAVVASRVDQAPDGGPSVIAGVVGRTSNGDARIAGVPVATGVSLMPEPGTFATVVGRHAGGALSPFDINEGRFVGAAGPLTNLSVEGYLEYAEQAPFYALSGLGHSFDRAAKLAPAFGRRAIFSGVYDGAFVVQEALPVPEDLGARRRALAAIRTGQSAIDAIPTR